MSYPPIRDYGIIGNLETCALVTGDGSIEWWCVPALDSPSVFAAILDEETGGHFAIRPTGDVEADRSYVERTNVLRTTFDTDGGRASLTDFMPIVGHGESAYTPVSLYRRVEGIDGSVEFELEFVPRFDYARADTTVERVSSGVIARGNREQLFLPDAVSYDVGGDGSERGGDGSERGGGRASARFTVGPEDTLWFPLQYDARETVDDARCAELLAKTVDFWQDWAHGCEDPNSCAFPGRWHDSVVRSALTLKLLMNFRTHAIAAAPTTSLPEVVGGERNWDYRYSWIRDTAFVLQALDELGHEREARDAYDWCLNHCHVGDPGAIGQPLFPLSDRHGDMGETTLDHLEGYRGSGPVRVGNDATEQRQLDNYGELLLAIEELSERGDLPTTGSWEMVRAVVDHVCDVWENPDAGIWEVRSGPAHHVHSKVMCWCALDRGIELARENDFDAPLSRWEDERERIRAAVLDRGYSEEVGSFVQTFDDDRALDAATLRLGLVGFLPCEDERFQGTIDAIQERVTTEEGLVYRYRTDDGLSGQDNPFVLCSFWLVDALALSGRTDEALAHFEAVLEHASPLGLLSEEIDDETGELRGNYPQAISHIGLINSALYLSHALEGAETVAPIGADLE